MAHYFMDEEINEFLKQSPIYHYLYELWLEDWNEISETPEWFHEVMVEFHLTLRKNK